MVDPNPSFPIFKEARIIHAHVPAYISYYPDRNYYEKAVTTSEISFKDDEKKKQAAVKENDIHIDRLFATTYKKNSEHFFYKRAQVFMPIDKFSNQSATSTKSHNFWLRAFLRLRLFFCRKRRTRQSVKRGQHQGFQSQSKSTWPVPLK